MKIHFSSKAHYTFFVEQRERAKLEGIPADSYFSSFCYLCGLCAETRNHFPDLFDWKECGIRVSALTCGWQTGTSAKITRLAFNLWNGCGMESETSEEISVNYLPDELFCCEFQEYFFEAIRLRFPEYTSGGID